MEQMNAALGMLDLMIHPAFCVKNHEIVKVNPAARSLQIEEGTAIDSFLATGASEYDSFSDGCLYLSLCIHDLCYGASVTKMDELHIFVLDQLEHQSELQAIALAASELRAPLGSVMISTDQLFPAEYIRDNPQLQQQAQRINRSLQQLMRIVGNMSDAAKYSNFTQTATELCNVGAFLQEVLNRVSELTARAGVQVTFRDLSKGTLSLIDCEKMERTVMNLISNAVKFTHEGGNVDVSLTKNGNSLCLQVQDNGEGIPDELKGTVYRRYLRQPGLEDGHFGIGLGMVLIRSTAACLGGTVLIDQPGTHGTRVTMTFPIRQNPPEGVRSPIFRVDYAGERDHALIELSDVLPSELYDNI